MVPRIGQCSLSLQEALKKAQMEKQRKAELEDEKGRQRNVEEDLQQEEQQLLQRVMRMGLEQEEEMRELNTVGPVLPAVTCHCLSLPGSSCSQLFLSFPCPPCSWVPVQLRSTDTSCPHSCSSMPSAT